MEIESIQLSNFQCYSGNLTENCFKFGPGLNLVVGDNNSGKSKLFNGFYWVLRDQVFDSDLRTFIRMNPNFVSDQAKYKSEVGSSVSAEVILICIHRPYNNPIEVRYKFHRSYKIKKTGLNSYEHVASAFICSKQVLGRSWEICDADEETKAIGLVAPDSIRDYLWFLGEAGESVIDFQKPESVSKAIEVLSDISSYDKLVKIAGDAFDAGRRDYSREQRALSTDQSKAALLETEASSLEKSIGNARVLLSEAKESLEVSKQKISKSAHLVEDAKGLAKVELAIKELLSRTNSLSTEYQDLSLKYPNYLFEKKWLLRNGKSLIEKFIDKYEVYLECHIGKVALFTAAEKDVANVTAIIAKRGLGINEPSPVYIKKMLEDGVCRICERPAPKDSPAWMRIKELLPEDSAKSQGAKIFHNDFSPFLKLLYNDALSFRAFVGGIDESIGKTNSRLDGIAEAIRKAESDRKQKEREQRDLLGAANVENADSFVREMEHHANEVGRFGQMIEKFEGEIKSKTARLKEIEDQRRSLVRDEKSQSLLVLEKKQELLSDLSAICTATRSRVFDEIILQLQNEANKHFKEMTKGNNSVKGLIKLHKTGDGKYVPRIETDDGQEMRGINDANIALIKLSILMAIVSSKGRRAAAYPFLSDAPTSKFGEMYTEGFYKTISGVYGQSIVMSYDFSSDMASLERFITSMKEEDRYLGSVHLLKPIRTSENNRNDLSVKIEVIHGG